MGKKSSRTSLKEWACKNGCDLSNGVTCEHLEKLLPHQERGSHRQVKLIYTDKIEKMNMPSMEHETQISPQRINAFIRRLKSYELADHYITILVDKYIYNKTIAEITRDRGFTSAGVTFYLLKLALETLRNKGFRP